MDALGGPIFDRLAALLNVIHAFRKDSHSAVYFSLVLAMNLSPVPRERHFEEPRACPDD
jgi:hypothetical protein